MNGLLSESLTLSHVKIDGQFRNLVFKNQLDPDTEIVYLEMSILSLNGHPIVVQDVPDIERVLLNPTKLTVTLYRQPELLSRESEEEACLVLTFIEKSEYQSFQLLMKKNLPSIKFGAQADVFVQS